jgi:hypothetical protein
MNNVCERFINLHPKFGYLIVRYLGEDRNKELIDLALDHNSTELLHKLDQVWFELPDDVCNIKVNPPGWDEFLSLIEE